VKYDKKNYNIPHYQIISLFIKLNVQSNRYIWKQHKRQKQSFDVVSFTQHYKHDGLF